MQPNHATASDNHFRITLARTVTSLALAVILVISVIVLFFAGIDAVRTPSSEKTREFFDLAKDILSMLLPVVAAWVGTVLAFYFGKENFEAATRSASNLLYQLSPREKLQAEPVGRAMLKIADISTFRIAEGKTEGDVTLKQLIDTGFEKDKSRPRNRLPIIDSEGRGKYVLHRSTLDAFIAAKKHPPIADESTLTLKDLLEDPKMKDFVTNSFFPISETATLADAKDIFDTNPQCLDLLVTRDGSKAGIVVGWVTNVLVLNAATI